ncbi:transglutaminase domain-containing protein [Clostridium senegalense]|uniref:transglutaminase domain-containing protein n=1 Tax=Clostridium senegalense TaxID=1465809 RepID=UPI001C1051CA|nr:transglutaminase domain-containing protein [Clostridium senegalense]
MVNIILIAVLIYPIIIGFLKKNSTEALKEVINSIFTSLALIFSIIIGSKNVWIIFQMHNEGKFNNIYEYLPNWIMNLCTKNIFVTRIAVTISFILIIQVIIVFILWVVSNIILTPILEAIDSSLKRKSNLSRRIYGALFQSPKAICNLVILCFLLSFGAMFNKNPKYMNTLEESQIYTYVSKNVVNPVINSNVVKNLPQVVNESFKIIVEDTDISKNDKSVFNEYLDRKAVIYYNGITLDEGVKSSAAINKTALSIVKENESTYEKAEDIYNWIGNNIKYDDEKATEVISNNLKIVKSGAIEAFNTGKGVCFDYACLFVAMCRANDIQVRMVIGEGFNGEQWVNHSWNEFYDQSSGRWINVDTTFYSGGNYFDNNNFKNDHRNSKVVGEW